jgi:hypothetical protein
MQRLRCWFLGHDRMGTEAAHGVCLRCGQRATLTDLAREPARAEATGTADHGRLARMHVQVHWPHRAS